ncbi:hypothetical protein EJB05_12820, partial [Eragrostis curvula]
MSIRSTALPTPSPALTSFLLQFQPVSPSPSPPSCGRFITAFVYEGDDEFPQDDITFFVFFFPSSPSSFLNTRRQLILKGAGAIPGDSSESLSATCFRSGAEKGLNEVTVIHRRSCT